MGTIGELEQKAGIGSSSRRAQHSGFSSIISTGRPVSTRVSPNSSG